MAKQKKNLAQHIEVMLVLCASSTAGGQVFIYSESEPNNTLATAQVIPPPFPHFGFVQISGSVVPGDVDYFQLTLPAPIHVLSAAILTTPSVPPEPHHLSLAWFNAAGELVQVVHAQGSGAFLPLGLTTPGTYFVGVSGFSDPPFSGLHQQSFTYSLQIDFIPAPGALPLLWAAIVVSPARRRRC